MLGARLSTIGQGHGADGGPHARRDPRTRVAEVIAKERRTRLLTAVTVGAVTVALLGWLAFAIASGPEWESANFRNPSVSSDGLEVSVEVECSGARVASVVETGEAVEIHVEIVKDSSRDECATTVRVPLRSPLAGRAVVDVVSDRVFVGLTGP